MTAAVIATAEPAAAAAPRIARATFFLVDVFDFLLEGEETGTVIVCEAPDAEIRVETVVRLRFAADGRLAVEARRLGAFALADFFAPPRLVLLVLLRAPLADFFEELLRELPAVAAPVARRFFELLDAGLFDPVRRRTDDFFAEDFFAEDFFAEDFFAEDFFAEDFFAGDFRRDDFVPDDFFADDDFFAPLLPLLLFELAAISGTSMRQDRRRQFASTISKWFMPCPA